MKSMTPAPAESVRIAAETALGTRFHVEQTGGNCEAFVTYLDGGAVLVLTDGCLGIEFAYGEVVACLFRSLEEWENGADVIGYADTEDITAHGMRSLVSDVLFATVVGVR